MTDYDLTPVERRLLAQQHHILAKLEPEEQTHHMRQAEILEGGFVSEYAEGFYAIEPELSTGDCRFVIDVFNMFTTTEHSYTALQESEREQLGENAEHTLQFAGFDANGTRETKLLTFARHLIKRGDWSQLAVHFERAAENGNSHMPRADIYERMLEEHNAVFRDRGDDSSKYGPLTVEELRRILAASVHPDRR